MDRRNQRGRNNFRKKDFSRLKKSKNNLKAKETSGINRARDNDAQFHQNISFQRHEKLYAAHAEIVLYQVKL